MRKVTGKSATGVLLAALFGLHANAQVLVLKSTGANAAANYKAGTVIAETASIELHKGDHIVLLLGQATRTFDGPGNITPSEVFCRRLARRQTFSAGRECPRILLITEPAWFGWPNTAVPTRLVFCSTGCDVRKIPAATRRDFEKLLRRLAKYELRLARAA